MGALSRNYPGDRDIDSYLLYTRPTSTTSAGRLLDIVMRGDYEGGAMALARVSSPPPYAAYREKARKPSFAWEGVESFKFQPLYRIYPKPHEPAREGGWGIYIVRIQPNPLHADEMRRRLTFDVKAVGCIDAYEGKKTKVLEGMGTWEFSVGKRAEWSEWQVRVEAVGVADAETIEEIGDFLEEIKHIGPARRKKLIEWACERDENGAGLNVVSMLEEYGKEAFHEAGVPYMYVDESWESFVKLRAWRQTNRLLSRCGIKDDLRRKIMRYYEGTDFLKEMHSAPEELLEVSGISFESAHKVWMACGLEPDDLRVIASGMHYVIWKLSSSGDCWHTTQDVLQQAGGVLGIPDLPTKWFEEQYENRPEIGRVIYVDSFGNMWPKKLWEAENIIVERLAFLQKGHRLLEGKEELARTTLKRLRDAGKVRLDDTQFEAVLGVVGAGPKPNSVSILTGGPGTGKTASTKAAIDVLHALGISQVKVVAPTGKAADNATAKTQVAATTIHSLIGIGRSANETQFNVDNPLQVQAVFIDELSMVDTILGAHLLSAIPTGALVVFIGDPNQLPSVGPGALLRDFLLSRKLPVYALTKVYRQDENSHLHELYDAIQRNRPLKLIDAQGQAMYGDIEAIAITGPNAEQRIVDKVVEYYAEINDPDKCAIVTYRRGALSAPPDDPRGPQEYRDAGVFGINRRIVEDCIGEPPPGAITFTTNHQTFFKGLRCMWLTNTPASNSFDMKNGKVFDISDIYVVDEEGSKIEGKKDYDSLRQLVMEIKTKNAFGSVITIKVPVGDWKDAFMVGYAYTIHKSQGSEVPTLIFVVRPGDRFVMSKAAAYTAATRAKSNIIIIGDVASIFTLDERDTRRRTHLVEKLRKSL